MTDRLRLRVERKERECAGIHSLYLVSADGGPLPPATPGQYLTFFLRIPGQEHPAVRCYSLSEAPRGDRYRITVKRKPGGLGSGFLVDEVQPGAPLEALPPAGNFTITPRGATPIVLLAGGIGLSPLLGLVDAQVRGAAAPRETYLYLGIRRGAEHPFRSWLEEAARAHAWLHLRVAYSRPDPDDVEGRDFHERGHVDVELLKRTLPPAERPYEFYVCGPAAMTEDLLRDLEGLGIPPARIRTEAFQPATAKPISRRFSRKLVLGEGEEFPVTYARSGKTVAWDPKAETLLELAMQNGVFLSFACGTGHCGACMTRLEQGRVEYGVTPQATILPGNCLPCIGHPVSPVVLDA